MLSTRLSSKIPPGILCTNKLLERQASISRLPIKIERRVCDFSLAERVFSLLRLSRYDRTRASRSASYMPDVIMGLATENTTHVQIIMSIVTINEASGGSQEWSGRLVAGRDNRAASID